MTIRASVLSLSLRLAGCNAREAQIEECVKAYWTGNHNKLEEGPARVICMRAAYGEPVR
jgi:hypothetical protein